MVKYLILLLFFTGAVGSRERPAKPAFFTARYTMSNLPDADLFEAATLTGPVMNPAINEASGIAVSRQDPSLIWTHNDSGDENRIFLITDDGVHRATFYLKGAENRDWEDMAMGPGPVDGVNYLFVAEIGDNRAQYPEKFIYRLPEPDIAALAGDVSERETEQVDVISFVFPGMRMMDAETLLVDPRTKDIFIVTKREEPLTIYRLPFPQSTTETMVAEKYGTLPFTYAVGGDISSDGKEIIIKTYDKIFLWNREESETLADAFIRPPLQLNYTPEPQGEAIAFRKDGVGFYTLSEERNGIAPVVYFYQRSETE